MFIKDILNEELQNSVQIRKDYELALAKLPKGSLVRKVIGGREYFYLAFRNGSKVQFKYLGRLDQAAVDKYDQAKIFRAKYRKKLSEVSQQIKFIRKALRGKGSV